VQLEEHVISDSVNLIINKHKLQRACCEKLYIETCGNKVKKNLYRSHKLFSLAKTSSCYACAFTNYSADNRY